MPRYSQGYFTLKNQKKIAGNTLGIPRSTFRFSTPRQANDDKTKPEPDPVRARYGRRQRLCRV